MPRIRNQIAKDVAASLAAYETMFDNTLIAGSQLVVTMLHGRAEGQLAATVGQDALVRVTASLHGLARSRGEVVDGHAELETTRKQLGLAEVAAGGKVPQPRDAKEVVGLRVVN